MWEGEWDEVWEGVGDEEEEEEGEEEREEETEEVEEMEAVEVDDSRLAGGWGRGRQMRLVFYIFVVREEWKRDIQQGKQRVEPERSQ